MPEAEVALRVAMGLMERNFTTSTVEVAIDGAQIRTGNTVHFPIADFLAEAGWQPVLPSASWQGFYRHAEHEAVLRIHSSAGKGDVVAQLKYGRTLRAECKKGPLIRSKSSQEYPLVREALGQLLTVEEAASSDILAVVVPHSVRFETLANNWRERPLVVRAGIHIATINRKNEIKGLEDVLV